VVFHLQFPTAHLTRTSVNHQSDFQPVVSSTPDLCASKQTVKAKQLNSLEQSLQAVTISEKENSAVSSTDVQSVIAQKKRLQSEIALVTKEIEKLKVNPIVTIIIIVIQINDTHCLWCRSGHREVFSALFFCVLKGQYTFVYI